MVADDSAEHGLHNIKLRKAQLSLRLYKNYVLLFWEEQFQTTLADFKEDNGEIVHLHLRNFQPCCTSMHDNTKRLHAFTDH
jgi:hypothetical protein